MDSFNQLQFIGLQDCHLTGNPQISFYKSVYRRYTNFVLESKELIFKKNTLLSESNESFLNITLERHADLVKSIYLTMEIPDIYSGCSGSSTDYTYNVPYEFKWIENLGANIIDYSLLKINNVEVNKLYGEYIYLDSEINYTDSKKKIFNKMIGHVEENYNPKINSSGPKFIAIIKTAGTGYSSEIFSNTTTNARFNITANSSGALTSVTILDDGNNFKDHEVINITNALGATSGNDDAEIILISSSYPHLRSSNDNQYKINTDNAGLVIARNSEITGVSLQEFIPSIKAQKIKVPLNFFFNKNSTLSLPLVALQYSNVDLEFKLNPIRYLYTILKKNLDNNIVRGRPDIDITNFIKEDNFDIKPKIEVTYVYLDNEERKRIAAVSHEYLIEQVQRQELLDIQNTKEHRIYFSHPVKELIMVSQRSDMSSVNSWNNYTNWTLENSPPYSKLYNTFDNVLYDNNLNQYLFYNRLDSNTTDSSRNFKMKYFKKNIIENIKLIFNGNTRIESKDTDYFNLVQSFEHHNRRLKEGIHLYSFSLNPEDFQPSGSCNFSKIENFKIELDLGLKTNVKEIPVNSSTNQNYFNYNFNIYAVNYNILMINTGMGFLKYSD